MICRWAIVASVLLWPAIVGAAEGTVAERHAALSKEYVTQLAALADKCDELDLAPQAEQTRSWRAPRISGRILLFLSDHQENELPASAELRVKQWHARFLDNRQAYAAKVYLLAAEAAGTQQGELALRLIYEVLHEDPDHVEAERLLGLKRAVMRVAKPRQVSGVHPKFGWPGGKHWTIDTPHFAIESNAGPKACIDLGRDLERLHDAWRQLYFPLWGQDRLVAGRFANKDIELSEQKRFHVVLFKDRDEYVKQLGKAGAAAAVSSGFYSDEQEVSLFFAGADAKMSTWYHEVTHQLIQEYLAAPAGVAKSNSIWLVEAAALFMESLSFGDGYVLLGGYDADNLQFARFRARGGDFQMPLAELSALGREALQEHRGIRKIYGEMGGLSQFFMEGRDGQLPGPFLKALLAVYQGRAQVDTLAAACDTSYDKLDKEYYEFLDVTDAMIAKTPPLREIRGLSLRRTSVTDAGLASFRRCNQLQWLDLSATAAGDQGFAAFPASTMLKTLFLEQTKITDAALLHVAEFPDLEELYLSNTSLSDEGIANLTRLKKLKLLDLSDCPVTDAILPTLATLKQLESLETSGSKITTEGMAKLKRSLPKLKD